MCLAFLHNLMDFYGSIFWKSKYINTKTFVFNNTYGTLIKSFKHVDTEFNTFTNKKVFKINKTLQNAKMPVLTSLQFFFKMFTKKTFYV